MKISKHVEQLPNNVLLMRHEIALAMLAQAVKDLSQFMLSPKETERLSAIQQFLIDGKNPKVTGNQMD